MAVFLLKGSFSACQISDLCCEGNEVLTINSELDCCHADENTDQSKSSNDNSEMPCCADGIVTLALYLSNTYITYSTTENNYLDPGDPVVRPDYDFHVSIWQPPKTF